MGIAVLLLVGSGDSPQRIEVLEDSSCEAVVARESAQPDSAVSSEAVDGTILISVQRPVLGRASSIHYTCRNHRIRHQMIVSRFPTASDARHHWHSVRSALERTLGRPCLTADFEALEGAFPDLVEPEDGYLVLWRQGETRLSVGIQKPLGDSLDWRVIADSAPRNPSFQVAPDGSESEIPEPECITAR